MSVNVVELDPDQNPLVGTLTERLESVIGDYVEEERVTLAEVVGILTIISHTMIDDINKGL